MATGTNLLKTVDKTVDIIEQMKTDGPISVTELANQLGMPKSTVQVHLNTLKSRNLVINEESGYKLGFKFLEFGMHILENHTLFPTVKPKVDQLAESTGELAACFIEEAGQAVCIYVTGGDHSIHQNMAMGDRSYLHCTASGKAILAHLPQNRVDDIIETHGLVAETENTITDRDQLLQELKQIREEGYAQSIGESVTGMKVVAVPIKHDDRVIGAINIAGPANRFTGDMFEKELPQKLMGIANEIELNLAYNHAGL